MPSIQAYGAGVGSWVDVLKCRYMSANADMDGGFAAAPCMTAKPSCTSMTVIPVEVRPPT